MYGALIEFFEKGAVDGRLRKVLGILVTGFSSCYIHLHHLCTQFQTNVGGKSKVTYFFPNVTFFS